VKVVVAAYFSDDGSRGFHRRIASRMIVRCSATGNGAPSESRLTAMTVSARQPPALNTRRPALGVRCRHNTRPAESRSDVRFDRARICYTGSNRLAALIKPVRVYERVSLGPNPIISVRVRETYGGAIAGARQDTCACLGKSADTPRPARTSSA